MGEDNIHNIMRDAHEINVTGQGKINSTVGDRTWVTGAIAVVENNNEYERIPVHFGIQERGLYDGDDEKPDYKREGEFEVFLALGHIADCSGHIDPRSSYIANDNSSEDEVVRGIPYDAAKQLRQLLDSNFSTIKWNNTDEPWFTKIFEAPRRKKFP